MSEQLTNSAESPLCSEPGCTRPAKVRGQCPYHYSKRRAELIEAGKWDSRERPSKRAQCKIEGCTNPTEARGLCLLHYRRARKLAVEQGTWEPMTRDQYANVNPTRRAD